MLLVLQWSYNYRMTSGAKLRYTSPIGDSRLILVRYQTDAAEEAKVTESLRPLPSWPSCQYFHNICNLRLVTHDFPIMLGSPGVVVQIDESMFKHHAAKGTTISLNTTKVPNLIMISY